jgi:hypothetical protein
MDTKILIKNLNKVFCKSNKQDKKYTEVWLSDVDFGGLYRTDKYYVLNVKAEHKIDNCNSEIREILAMLENEAKEELSHIWRVDVYHVGEDVYCIGEDLFVYSENAAC